MVAPSSSFQEELGAQEEREEDEERRRVEEMELVKREEELLAVPAALRTRAQFARLRELLGALLLLVSEEKGYWFLLPVIVMPVRRLRQASSPGLRFVSCA